MSARRGWLPKGFTELEYLESSGTQYIAVGTWNSVDLVTEAEFFIPEGSVDGISRAVVAGSAYFGNGKFLWVSTVFQYRAAVQQPSVYVEYDYNINIPSAAGRKNNIILRSDEFILNGEVVKYPEAVSDFNAVVSIFAATTVNTVNYYSVLAKIYKIKFTQSDKKLDLYPVLDADGVPCMYDKVSKRCFYNNGSGTFGYRIKTTGETHTPMSLRDPYYTAPSGVYARPSGDNQLEILADTEEPTGDGWEWFANTGEAYEHFGIKQEELLTNDITND